MTSKNGILYPATQNVKVTDDYFGTKVPDPYRWLEEVNSNKVKDFVNAQNQLTDKYLKAPSVNAGGDKGVSGQQFRERIRSRLMDLWSHCEYNCPFKRGDHYFYFKDGSLYMLRSLANHVRSEQGKGEDGQLILDNEAISSNASSSKARISLSLSSNAKTDENFGDTMASISRDGSTLAYGLSENGSVWSEIHFKNLTTGKEYEDVLQNVRQDSYLAWTQDGDGLIYTKYPSKAVNYKDGKIFFHRLGTPQAQDKMILEFRNNPDWELKAKVSHCGEYLITYVLQDCGGHTKVCLTRMKKIMEHVNAPEATNVCPEYATIVKEFHWDYDYITNVGPTFYFLTNKRAPNRKVQAVNLTSLNDNKKYKWSNVVRQYKENVLDSAICVHQHYLVICYICQAHSLLQLRQLKNGSLLYDFPLELGAITGLTGRPQDSEFFFKFSTYLSPGTIYRVNLEQAEMANKETLENDGDGEGNCKCCGPCCSKSVEFTCPKELEVFSESIHQGFDPDKYQVSQIFYMSKDRVRVSMFLVHKKTLVKNGKNPCLLYGYGGFNASLQPGFDPTVILFIEHFNGIYAVANIRGGGEYGNKWYQEGIRFKKQNSLNDFQFAAKYLIRSKYTCPSKLVIRGNSNGGMIVAASVNQRPELFGAAIVGFGVLDLLRFHKFSSGSCWISDYGSPENKQDFRNLNLISPYHNVSLQENVQYPAMLLITAENDEIVLPLHSYKMIAQLQSKIGNSSKQENPLLLRVEGNSGHGCGGMSFETMIDETTDILTFIKISLGLEFHE